MHIQSTYKSSFPISNGHLETIVPYYLRSVESAPYSRERIHTKDQDFLDLDWIQSKNNKLVVLSHGLEGCSRSNYIQGMAHYLNKRSYDILAWNNRGCSGEMNKQIKMYHSGASHDLREVLNHVFHKTDYQEINLVGFSMGGNMTLKYLGEESASVNSRIKKAIALSTPVSLSDCSEALSNGFSLVYSKNFIVRLNKKLVQKSQQIPEFKPDMKKLKKMWKFRDFDNEITAPLNGFKNAEDYWDKASSLHYLKDIKVKSLIINAKNDPFLNGRCFPYEATKQHPLLDLETPERGGHVGFVKKGLSEFWSESRAFEYLLS